MFPAGSCDGGSIQQPVRQRLVLQGYTPDSGSTIHIPGANSHPNLLRLGKLLPSVTHHPLQRNWGYWERAQKTYIIYNDIGLAVCRTTRLDEQTHTIVPSAIKYPVPSTQCYQYPVLSVPSAISTQCPVPSTQ